MNLLKPRTQALKNYILPLKDLKEELGFAMSMGKLETLISR